MLDLGFAKSLNSILEYISSERQTMLFSATQTKSLRDIARLSLKVLHSINFSFTSQEPEYISVDEHADSKTPSGLTQLGLYCEPAR